MKQIKSQYKGNHKSMYIVPIGDLHIGNKYYDPAQLENTFKFIDANRNRCRIYLMGDLLESATKNGVGRSVYDEAYPTQKQFETAIDLFKPYADLIDVIVEGNHEERIIRDTSFEIVEELAHRIGRHDAYGKFNSIVNTMVGDLAYSAYVWHGATGGTTESGAINSLLKMRERAFCHMYFMGHTHKLIGIDREIYVPQPNSDEPAKIRQMFVNTGCALGEGGYGDQKGYPFNRIGFGAVQLFADSRRMVFHKIEDLI